MFGQWLVESEFVNYRIILVSLQELLGFVAKAFPVVPAESG